MASDSVHNSCRICLVHMIESSMHQALTCNQSPAHHGIDLNPICHFSSTVQRNSTSTSSQTRTSDTQARKTESLTPATAPPLLDSHHRLHVVLAGSSKSTNAATGLCIQLVGLVVAALEAGQTLEAHRYCRWSFLRNANSRRSNFWILESVSGFNSARCCCSKRIALLCTYLI
jgi:hypothetical protein